jgi:hypothetical protein
MRAREVGASLPFLGASKSGQFRSRQLSLDLESRKLRNAFCAASRERPHHSARATPPHALSRDYQGSEDWDSEGAHTASERVSLDTRALVSGRSVARGK